MLRFIPRATPDTLPRLRKSSGFESSDQGDILQAWEHDSIWEEGEKKEEKRLFQRPTGLPQWEETPERGAACEETKMEEKKEHGGGETGADGFWSMERERERESASALLFRTGSLRRVHFSKFLARGTGCLGL